MKLVYWLLAAFATILLLTAFGFFNSPESGLVAAEQLDQWYLTGTLIAAIIGGIAGLAYGLLVPRLMRARRGEATDKFHNRVILWGLAGAVTSQVLTLLVTLQLAYGNAEWQLAPSERLALVASGGRFLGILGAAWLVSALVYTTIVSTRAWNGRGALLVRR